MAERLHRLSLDGKKLCTPRPAQPAERTLPCSLRPTNHADENGFAEIENHLASKRPLVRSAANWTFSWSNSGIVVSMVTQVPVIVPRMKAVVFPAGSLPLSAVQGQYNQNWFLGVSSRSSQGIAERPLPCNYNMIQFVCAFHGGNTGSNPVGDAKSYQQLGGTATVFRRHKNWPGRLARSSE
jgi:hypothetical protein